MAKFSQIEHATNVAEGLIEALNNSLANQMAIDDPLLTRMKVGSRFFDTLEEAKLFYGSRISSGQWVERPKPIKRGRGFTVATRDYTWDS